MALPSCLHRLEPRHLVCARKRNPEIQSVAARSLWRRRRSRRECADRSQIRCLPHRDAATTNVRNQNALSPSNAVVHGPFNPFPVRVASTVPASEPVARTTVTLFAVWLGTQMLVPSNAGNLGSSPHRLIAVWLRLNSIGVACPLLRRCQSPTCSNHHRQSPKDW